MHQVHTLVHTKHNTELFIIMKISLTASALILFQCTLPSTTTGVNHTYIEEVDNQGNSGDVDEDNDPKDHDVLGGHPLFPYLEPEQGDGSEEDGEETEIIDGEIQEAFTDLGQLLDSLFGDLDGEMEDISSNQGMEGNDTNTDSFSDFQDFFDGLDLDTSPFEDGDGDSNVPVAGGDDFLNSFLDGFDADASTSGGLGDDFLGSMLGGGFMGEAMGALEIVPPELLQCVGFDLDSGIDEMDTPFMNNEEKCLEKETAAFKQQISDFDQCTGKS